MLAHGALFWCIPVDGPVMGQEPWQVANLRHERAIRGTAMLFSLAVAATMFMSLSALTARGAEYDCGPAAFALFAGPGQQTVDAADCRRAASQRLTTVTGLVVLATVGAILGPRLLAIPAAPMPSDDRGAAPLPSERSRPPRPARRRRPFTDAVG